MSNTEKCFSDMSIDERLSYLKNNSTLTDEELTLISSGTGLNIAAADQMVENVVGTYALPYCIAPGFVINGREMIIPMAGEEPYVIKSTTNGASIAAKNGGFIASTTGSIMIGQIQMIKIQNPQTARVKILENKEEIMQAANKVDPVLISFGGGCKDVEVRTIDVPSETMVIVHLIIDVCDAMGAQAINAMAEAAAPVIEKIAGGKANLKVLSNRAVYRLARARVCVKKEDLGGEENVDKFVSAYRFASSDPFRAATNNKGVMNGMIPVVVATGNDTRAVESGVHSYACRDGKYKSITIWEKNADGDLEGMIETPMAVGIVGGTTKLHPIAQASLKMMGIRSALELEEVIACVGLAANLGVLYSLVTVGLHGDFEAAKKHNDTTAN